jgi:hypothetical protein
MSCGRCVHCAVVAEALWCVFVAIPAQVWQGFVSCNDDVTYRSVLSLCWGDSCVVAVRMLPFSARYCVLCTCSAVSVPVPFLIVFILCIMCCFNCTHVNRLSTALHKPVFVWPDCSDGTNLSGFSFKRNLELDFSYWSLAQCQLVA